MVAAKEGWRSRDTDFSRSKAQKLRGCYKAYPSDREEDDDDSGWTLWPAFLSPIVRQGEARGPGLQLQTRLQLVPGGIKKYKRYIRPKLMPRHYISRLEWVLDDLVKDENGVPKLLPHDSILGGRA